MATGRGREKGSSSPFLFCFSAEEEEETARNGKLYCNFAAVRMGKKWFECYLLLAFAVSRKQKRKRTSIFVGIRWNERRTEEA